MLLTTLIERKRDGEALAPEELRRLLDAYLTGELADYQMSAFLMAVFIRGLSPPELTELTRAIIASGTRFDPGEGPPAVDKHSTGGVGDKVSLVLAPLVAEAGLRVPMMSGRGLGHTGGTLDKLESIPGFEVRIDIERFRVILADVGCAMIGQTDEIAPLDGRLYALRDVTGTVPSAALMSASIISKKVAEGISALVLDVKCGRGAFMTGREDAEALARTMVDLAAAEGVTAAALLTRMDAPLGRMVGNALEVREAIECLRGEGPADLREVTLALAAEMLVLGGIERDADAARTRLEGLLDDGRALERFRRLVEAQSGDPRVVDDPDRLPAAPVRREVAAPGAGIVDIDARGVGLAAVALGAGRRKTEDDVDPRVGFEFHVRAGEAVEAGAPLVTIHAADERAARSAALAVEDAVALDDAGSPAPLILSRIA